MGGGGGSSVVNKGSRGNFMLSTAPLLLLSTSVPSFSVCTVLQSKRFNFVSFYIKLYNLKPDVY